MNNTAFFTANDGVHGVELWRSNGQSAGTVRVKDIRPGAQGSSPTNFFNLNSTLFFSANNGTTGVELWKSTAFGPETLQAANINSGAGSSNPWFIASSATTLFFAANSSASGTELWTLANPASAAPQSLSSRSSSIFGGGLSTSANILVSSSSPENLFAATLSETEPSITTGNEPVRSPWAFVHSPDRFWHSDSNDNIPLSF